MNRVEHLLVILGEEAAEITKECAKALRFGPEEVYAEIGISNAARILAEYNDLVAMVEMLQVENVFPAEIRNEQQIHDKKVKVEKHLEYSRKCGTLSD